MGKMRCFFSVEYVASVVAPQNLIAFHAFPGGNIGECDLATFEGNWLGCDRSGSGRKLEGEVDVTLRLLTSSKR
jgi:hypothetical protein